MLNTVYFDMDGVLADWVDGFERQFPHIPYCQYNTLSKKEQKTFRRELDGNGHFYRELKPFNQVLAAVTKLKELGYQVEILSSVGTLFPDLVIEQKKAWLQEHLTIDITANFVNKSEHKARYAHKNALLLDDRARSVNPFLKAGGRSVIFHGHEVSQPQQVIDLVAQRFDD